MEINIGISNRHVHLKQEDVDILFEIGRASCRERV